MMLHLTLFSVLLSLLVSSASTAVISYSKPFPDPEPCDGDCGFVHDPYVILRDDGTYFRFATSDKIQIATSLSLNGTWKTEGSALPEGSQVALPGNKDLWAPDVHFFNGTYYMYYAVSVAGSQNSAIGLATSPSMDIGTWTDHGSLGIPQSSHYNLIDPNLLIVNYGTGFKLSFGSFWDDIYQIDLLNPTTVAPGAEPRQIALNTNGLHPTEGSFQFWWETKGVVYFYLFMSTGLCCSIPPNLPPPGEEYKITVCRSTSENGPFVDKEGKDCRTENGASLVLGSHGDVYAPGGQGVLYDPNLQSIVLYYHYVNRKVGYNREDFLFGWNKMVIRDDGWPEVV